MSSLDRRPWSWLALGVALVVFVHLRFGIGAFAWVAAVPFLRFLRLRPGVAPALAVVGASAVAWTLAMVKIATAPLPLVFAPVFGVPMGLTFAVPLVIYAALRRRMTSPLTPLAFTRAFGRWAGEPPGAWRAAHTAGS